MKDRFESFFGAKIESFLFSLCSLYINKPTQFHPFLFRTARVLVDSDSNLVKTPAVDTITSVKDEKSS